MPTELDVVVGPGLSPGSAASRLSRRRWAGSALVALLALTGCTSATSGAAGTSSPASSTAPTATGDSPSDPAAPTGTPAPPLPNPAPSSIPKVTRPGSTGGPTATVAPAAFAAPAIYPDGVIVTITRASKAVETGQGPGVFTGRELLVVDVEITNGSGQAIPLNQVVITTSYGQSKQLAPGVYPGNLEVRDFSGTVAAGSKASARYAFAVPAAELSVVTMVVDFDAAHASAVFTGAVSV